MTSLRRDRVSLQFLAAKPETLAGLPLTGQYIDTLTFNIGPKK